MRPPLTSFAETNTTGKVRFAEDAWNSRSEESSDLGQILARGADQKEGGFNTMASCKVLIRAGHCRNQLAASTKDLERAALYFAADARAAHFMLEGVRPPPKGKIVLAAS